ncbi:MAG: M23 family peptidase, partial [Kiloniellales bacterium]|nr:M23 family peptidase [Kiloniellales bacterium]
MRRWAAIAACTAAWLATAPAWAQDLTLTGAFSQGGLITGQTRPGTEVRLDGQPVRVGADGRFLLGFGRDAPPEAVLELTLPDGTLARRTLTIA